MELHNATSQLGLQATLSPEAYPKNQPQNRDDSKGVSQDRRPDTVSISPEAQEMNLAAEGVADDANESADETSQELSQEELATVTELQARDTEVRAHEQAHLAAAGGHATGGPSFTLQKGPDGQTYAVGGEVGIDLSTENDPSATIQKMQTIQRAAMAPASPSSTDRQVAAQASVKEAQARQELLQEQQEVLLGAENESTSFEPASSTQDNSSSTPSISSLKASLAAYEQMSAL